MDTTIQQNIQTIQIELPKCDMTFIKKLATNMGWNIKKKQVVSEETLKMMKRSRKEYKEGKVISFNSASDAQQWLNSL